MPTIYHVFNSSLVSGPETLVLPNLVGFQQPVKIILLQESRLPAGSQTVNNYARSLGFETIEFPVKGRFDWKAINLLADFLKKSPANILHSHGPKASLYSLIALKRAQQRKQTKLITTHHGVRANDTQLKLKFFELIYEKAVIPYTDLCLTVCSSDKLLLEKRGVKPDIIKVHLNGVDRQLFESSERKKIHAETRESWSKHLSQDLSGEYLIGVVGRLAKEKQYDLILKGFRELLNQKPSTKIRILCFGSGPLEAELKTLSKSLDLEQKVHWMGYRRDISQEMNALDLLLSASSAEGLPINLIEAGWAGIPVLAHAVDGINDLIENGVSGTLIQSPLTPEKITSALKEAISSDSKNFAMAKVFQKRVLEKFSKTAWVTRLNEIYKVFQ